jgi:hypothetical protein
MRPTAPSAPLAWPSAIRMAASTVAERPWPWAQWTYTSRPARSSVSAQSTADWMAGASGAWVSAGRAKGRRQGGRQGGRSAPHLQPRQLSLNTKLPQQQAF